MSALSRGLISHLRLIASNPTRTTTTTTTTAPYPFFFFLRRFGTADALVDGASEESSQEQQIRVMTRNSKRTGVIAVKCGMSALWDKWGARVPITVLWVDDNIVSQVKTLQKEGITALQVLSQTSQLNLFYF
jgi:large subunit ribosomal protein L3